MAAAERPLTVVTTPAAKSQDAFASAVQQVVEAHGDVASEQCWQDFSRLIAAHWTGLCRDQGPAQTWSMLARSTETIIRLRRGLQQDKGQSAGDALEEFRAFMNDVVRPDGEA